MSVMTKAKDLISITFQYTENWPKVDRFTVKDRVRNTALEIYELLITANETFVDFKLLEGSRQEHQGLRSQAPGTAAGLPDRTGAGQAPTRSS